MAEIKNVGNHAEDLADGRMIAPGETAKLTDAQLKEPHNADLLEREAFIKLEGKEK
jgi:hypothetical protein